MNIQFMTKEKNGVPNGELDWRGNPKYDYVPDYDEMIKNATCPEEVNAINETKKMTDRYRGFAFEIVFTWYGKPHYGEDEKWHVYQFPWYRTPDGIYKTKEEMIEIIKKSGIRLT